MFLILSITTKTIQIQKTWEDFYPNDQFSVEKFQETTRIEGSDLNNFYIHDCMMQNIQNSANGGAIYCMLSSGENCKLLIEFCNFFSCSSSKDGGCIYTRFCQYSASHNCASSCSSESSGLYEYIDRSSNNKESKEFSSSITKSTGNIYNIYKYQDDAVYSHVNISYTNCKEVSAIFSSDSSQTISYSLFTNNTAESKLLETNGKDHSISYSNILYNSENEEYSGLIDVNNQMTISNSFFEGNSATSYIFYGTFTFINCSISKDQLICNNPNNLNTKSMTPENSFINEIYFLNTAFCLAPTKPPTRSPLPTQTSTEPLPSPSSEISSDSPSISPSFSTPDSSSKFTESLDEDDSTIESSSSQTSESSDDESTFISSDTKSDLSSSNSDESSSGTSQINSQKTTDDSDHENGSNTSTIVIIIVVLLVVIALLIIGIAIYCFIKRRRNAFETETSDWLVGYDIQVV